VGASAARGVRGGRGDVAAMTARASGRVPTMMSRWSVLLPRLMVSRTFCPGSAEPNRLAPCGDVMEIPSTCVILSPVRIPARPAGLSESTLETVGISGDSQRGGASREIVVHPQPLQRTEKPYHPLGRTAIGATPGVPIDQTPGGGGVDGTDGWEG
jgi:hypothetical protein